MSPRLAGDGRRAAGELQRRAPRFTEAWLRALRWDSPRAFLIAEFAGTRWLLA